MIRVDHRSRPFDYGGASVVVGGHGGPPLQKLSGYAVGADLRVRPPLTAVFTGATLV